MYVIAHIDSPLQNNNTRKVLLLYYGLGLVRIRKTR